MLTPKQIAVLFYGRLACLVAIAALLMGCGLWKRSGEAFALGFCFMLAAAVLFLWVEFGGRA